MLFSEFEYIFFRTEKSFAWSLERHGHAWCCSDVVGHRFVGMGCMECSVTLHAAGYPLHALKFVGMQSVNVPSSVVSAVSLLIMVESDG